MRDWCTRAACPAVQINPLYNTSRQFQSLLWRKLHSPGLSGLQGDKQNRKEYNANTTWGVIMHRKQKIKSQTGCLFLLLKSPNSPDFSIVFYSLHEIIWEEKKCTCLSDRQTCPNSSAFTLVRIIIDFEILKVLRHKFSISNFHRSMSTFYAAFSSSNHSPRSRLFGKC